MKTFLYVILGLIGIGFIATCGDGSSEETKEKDVKLELTADQSSLLFDVEYDGHVEFKESENEIWVKPLFWNVCNYQAKTNLTYLSAIRCGNAKGSTDYSCTVYDMMTGKKLAKWDELWGFEMEE
jgi:hypothetical protein